VPDISTSQAVEVAIGLTFLFFMLSLICSTVNELVAGVLAWRARFLEDGLRSMLARIDDATSADALLVDLAKHPLINGKVATPRTGEPRGLRGRLARLRSKLSTSHDFPSYLNSKTFALTFLDTVAPPQQANGEPPGGDRNAVLDRVRAYAETLAPGDPVARALRAFLDQAGNDVNRFRRSVESWFDLTMDRVSGWYKRRTQISLAVIATVVTLLLNADAFQVGRALWNDDAVRAAVVAQAQQSVDAGEAEADVGEGVREDVEQLSEQVADVNALKLPLGWSTNPDDPRWFDSPTGAVGKVLGLLATVLALTLGAPFWFDLLGRFSRIRTSGKPERPGAV
jgi:hypothetical protein